MNISILKAFRENTLTEKMLIEEHITETARGLYVYMLYLEKMNRLTESNMLKDLREILFTARDNWRCDNINQSQLRGIIDNVGVEISLQMLMVSVNETNSWEKLFVDNGYINVLLGFRNSLN